MAFKAYENQKWKFQYITIQQTIPFNSNNKTISTMQIFKMFMLPSSNDTKYFYSCCINWYRFYQKCQKTQKHDTVKFVQQKKIPEKKKKNEKNWYDWKKMWDCFKSLQLHLQGNLGSWKSQAGLKSIPPICSNEKIYI